MFKNKRLFLISLVVGIVLLLCINFPFVAFVDKTYVSIGIFIMVNCVLAAVLYTLIFCSLQKKFIVKRIYLVVMIAVGAIFLMGMFYVFH